MLKWNGKGEGRRVKRERGREIGRGKDKGLKGKVEGLKGNGKGLKGDGKG